MLPDSFSTARLLLRPIAPDDAGPIFRTYSNDPVVTRFLTWQPHRHPDQAAAYRPLLGDAPRDCLSYARVR